jgi:hypothetical protein
MQIKKINWQRPLVERLAKFFRAPVTEIEAIMRLRSDPFTRRAAMLDALCDQQGVHLAMNTPMVERLEALQLAERLLACASCCRRTNVENVSSRARRSRPLRQCVAWSGRPSSPKRSLEYPPEADRYQPRAPGLRC